MTALSAAQESDGYLNSFVQAGKRERFADLAFGHELYCAGHLIQAAVANHRSTGDTGLLTVDASLQVRVSGALSDAVRADPLTRQYYGRPPLRDTILLPDQAQLPGRKYLDWHKTNIFVV